MLVCQSLAYQIDGKLLFEEVNFTVQSGEPLLILGPSGSGKTTLLSILAGMIPPTTGTVTYDGQNFQAFSPAQCDAFRGQNIGFVFQNLHLVRFLSVRQNLMLACSLADKSVSDRTFYKVLSRLGVAELLDQRADRLSAGEQQRVAVARAIIGEPRWIFCDEPTSALDDANTQSMVALLKSEAAHCGASLIVVTHDKRVKEAFDDQACFYLNGQGGRR